MEGMRCTAFYGNCHNGIQLAEIQQAAGIKSEHMFFINLICEYDKLFVIIKLKKIKNV